jgi:rhamnogalacturonyl hydrolase YesR
MTHSGLRQRRPGFAPAVVIALALAVTPMLSWAAEVTTLDIGLTAAGDLIGGLEIPAADPGAPTVTLVGGLSGDDSSSRAIREAVAAYAGLSDAERNFELRAVPVANPRAAALEFPPTGAAYRENAESHVLWRWLGLSAPDLVLIVGADPAGLASLLKTARVGGVGTIPTLSVDPVGVLQEIMAASPQPSPARLEIERRRELSPLEFANRLAPIYGQSFNSPIYIDGMGLIAQLGLGNVEHVESLAEPYIDGSRDSLGGGAFGISTLVLAGHLAFAELAEQTGDPRYLDRARAAADVSFDDNGQMLEATPGHGEMSDAIFMGASILAHVGHLTGEQRYFDMAARQIAFMNKLVLRDDGLYRHSPLTDAAWARGNGFAAIGYALTLSKLPADHPAYPQLLGEYRNLMMTLANWQDEDGTWRQVVDVPGAYHETSSTAIIGFSMQRGLNLGLLPQDFRQNVDKAWQGLATRTDSDGGFIDVSESTNKQPSLEAYLHREALFGRDARTGSFAMLFAVERARADGSLPAQD